ncbi:MAG: hypothetical protein QXX68_01045 [Candidatus Pacearchaeota archaeon]
MHARVNLIISSGSSDKKEIERNLDFLLETMIFGEGRDDFLRLVTYYHRLDKEGANFYHRNALEEILLSRMNYLTN